MSWKPMDVLNGWSINRYSSDFKGGRPTKRKISINGKWRLNQLKEKNTDIRFTAQKKVNGVWVTTDIPMDIQCMVEDAYKEIEEDNKEAGPLSHIAQIEKDMQWEKMCARPASPRIWDGQGPLYPGMHLEVRPQLQDDLAQRQKDGYLRLYNAIMKVGGDDHKCEIGPLCCCNERQQRSCGNWQEKQVEDKELTHEEKLACKNETKQCDGWPFCECDEYEPVVVGYAAEDIKKDEWGTVNIPTFGTVTRTHSIFNCDGDGNPVEFNPLGPDAPMVINEKGGKQSKVEGFFMGLPAKAIIEVAKVLEHGREKYGKDNWRQIDSESHLNHLQMHIYGDMTNDRSEGPVGHLAHAACRSLMALEMAIEERGE